MNYHGIWSKDKKGTPATQAAARRIVEIASEVDCPVVICGDFNLFPDTESMRILNNAFTSLIEQYQITRTRPQSNELSGEGRNVVDYLFVSKSLRVKTFAVPDVEVSDHLPLVAEFDL